MRKIKGQSSVEYLSIVAIALLVLIPGAYLFLNYSTGATEQVAGNQLNLAGREIISEAQKMYVLGSNSWVTLEVSFPGNFVEASISNGNDMYFTYMTSTGESTVVFFPVGFNISNSSTTPCASVDCPLNFFPGVNRVRIQSQGDFVSIVRR